MRGTWGREFCDVVPKFSAALGERLLDVRVGTLPDGPVLLYLLRSQTGRLLTWVGRDPRGYADPIFAAAFPAPMLTFLQQTHAGFAAQDGVRFGMMPPGQMITLAESVGLPDGIVDFDDLHAVSSTRLVWVSENQSILRYLLSPDLPPGTSALLYEGDLDVGDAGEQLDELMMIHIED